MWSALGTHLLTRMGTKEGAEAMQMLEDRCVELEAVAAGGFDDRQGQDAVTQVVTDVVEDLYIASASRGDAWKELPAIANIYLYACLRDVPLMRRALAAPAAADAARLGLALDID